MKRYIGLTTLFIGMKKNEIGFHVDELEILNKLRKEAMGLASIHIDVPESVREVILWPLIKDKSRILLK